MNALNNTSITSYKKILDMVIKLEKDEEEFRSNRFESLLVFFLISVAILIGYVFYKWNSGLSISKEVVGIALSPVFAYLLRSYEEDYLSQRRAYLLKLIYDTFGKDYPTKQPFPDAPIELEEIKTIIRDAIKSKL